MKGFTLFFAFLLCTQSYGQKDKGRSLFVGVNLGTKIANKNYAQRYNGIYSHYGSNQTQLEYFLYTPQNYNAIRERLQGVDFVVPFDAYSLNTTYTPGLLTGVTLGYQISPNLQVSTDLNINRLKVRDVFTIQTLDGGIQTSQDQFQLGEIYAEESRFDARFNFDYVGDGNGTIKPIIGASGLFTSWRIDEHFVTFRGYTIPLFSQFNAQLENETHVTRGNGWGLGLNLGLEYRINDQIVSQIMYQPYQTFVDYGIFINKRILLQHDIVIRFLWK